MNTLNLNQLTEMGAVIPAAPVAEEITWIPPDGGDPVTFTVFVKRLAYGDYERLFMEALDVAAADEPEDPDADQEGQAKAILKRQDIPKRSRQALLISISIRLGDGTEQMSYEQAYQLQPSLASAFVRAINKTNGSLKKKAQPDRGVLARARPERDRGTDDRGGEGEPEPAGGAAVDGVLQTPGNPEPEPQT